MKTLIQAFLFAFLMGYSFISLSQGTNASGTNKNPHISLDNFPSDKPLNFIEGWGGMTVAVNEMPAGTDFKPLLEGLKNDSCQVPHWGYILMGVLRLTYDDGTEVILKEGDVFYMPPGHVAVVEEDLKLMDFSPEKGFSDLMKHLEAKMAESIE